MPPTYEKKIMYPKLERRTLENSRAHYQSLGLNLTDQEIHERVYGGLPLSELYDRIRIRTDDDGLRGLRVDILLLANSGTSIPDLSMRNVSLRQFLVSGLPLVEWRDRKKWLDENGVWIGDDLWDGLDPQYRLELCHSEISRWSIFFKRDGKTKGGAIIEGDDELLDIELINNCTTTTGFEFRMKDRAGLTYHGSFGESGDEDESTSLYAMLSRLQAGSLAKQKAKIVGRLSFFEGIYHNFYEWGPTSKKLTPQDTIPIEIAGRYRERDPVEEVDVHLEIEKGRIDYRRWGEGSEYYRKPRVRQLMHGIETSGVVKKEPPETYSEIHDAKEITLPNFQPQGIYDFGDLLKKRGYPWLFEFECARLRKFVTGPQRTVRYELELQRHENAGAFELRRIVLGNLSLGRIPEYPDFLTFHRFGYGPRPTEMDYDANFRPTSTPEAPALFAFLLAGETVESANSYVTPESFGVERAILSWTPRAGDQPREVVIDLISFERILPVWQGKLTFRRGFTP